MKSLKCSAALAALAAPLLLAACGGGGGSSSGGGAAMMEMEELSRVGAVDPVQAHAAIGTAGKATPRHGSVLQASNTAATSASWNGSRFGLTVGALSLNSRDHVRDVESWETPVMGHTGSIWTMSAESQTSLFATSALVSWNEADTSDWLVAGLWMHATGNINVPQINSVEAGAFVDGPEFADRTSVPSTGSATYTGIVGGIYSSGNPSDLTSYYVDLVEGTVSLSADFASSTIDGTITGTRGAEGVEMTLGSVIYTANGRISNGDVTLAIDGNAIVGATGKWGAQFSTMDNNGEPRAVAGTAGVEWTQGGNAGAFVGAFVATK